MRRKLAVAAMGVVLAGCQLSFTTVGAWTQLAPSPESISGASVATLADGRVLAVGGFNPNSGRPLGQALLFDPRSNRWTQGTPLPEPRSEGAVMALANGMVLVTGGEGVGPGGSPGPPLASTWLYDPRHDSWRRVGALPIGLVGPSAVRLSDGRVLLVGGSILRPQPLQLANGGTDLYQEVGSTEMFDPVSNRWTVAGSLNTVRSSMALVALRDGMALAAGGCTSQNEAAQGTPEPLESAELFDPTTKSWRSTSPLPSPRCGGSAVLLQDGRALVVGGSTTDFEPLTTAIAFDPRTRSWTPAGTTAGGGTLFSISGPQPVVLRDGRVFLPAAQQGQPQGRLTTTVVGGQIYLPMENAWRYVTSVSVVAASRFGQPGPPTGVLLASGRVLALLESATLAFDPNSAPPPGQALDNLALTFILFGLAAALGLFLGAGYVLQRRSRTMEALSA